jgi:hypothetical protein
MFLCVLLTLLFYQIYSLLNQSPPLYIWTRLSQLYIRPAVCRDAGAAAVDTRPTGPSSGRPKKRTRESMHHPSYSVLSCARWGEHFCSFSIWFFLIFFRKTKWFTPFSCLEFGLHERESLGRFKKNPKKGVGRND